MSRFTAWPVSNWHCLRWRPQLVEMLIHAVVSDHYVYAVGELSSSAPAIHPGETATRKRAVDGGIHARGGVDGGYRLMLPARG